MKRQIGNYGKIILACIVVGIGLAAFAGIGKQIYDKAPQKGEVIADNVSEDMLMLASGKKYPFFTGSQYITINRNYKGEDNVVGFSREDALSFVKAYEYIWKDGQESIQEISKEKIQVYPFDEKSGQQRTMVDVSTTGKYTVRYSVEGESGLSADMIMVVLVDVLSGEQEYLESGGGNESSY